MPRKKREPCQAEACAIQKCLQENNLQQDMCKDTIYNMIKCCAQIEARSIPRCSGFLELIQKEQN